MRITKKEDFLPESFDYSEEDARFMEMAIALSEQNVDEGGGPFGAVIVRGGELIATGANRVVPNNDPTAHAEVTAIRNACQKLGTFQLEG
ncbi:MAG: nucleoside deaminase, partial [Alistipes sp.]|nr:nucleoside deaminase [Alistipes sp.]